MFLVAFYFAMALAAVDVPTPDGSEIPAQGTAEGALTSCSDELSPMGRSISGTPCTEWRTNRPVAIPPAPASSMQKPGGWMPSDAPGSSP
jgi:hypothetical protein